MINGLGRIGRATLKVLTEIGEVQLQTLLELSADSDSTVVFPVPVDIVTSFLKHPEALADIAVSFNDDR